MSKHTPGTLDYVVTVPVQDGYQKPVSASRRHWLAPHIVCKDGTRLSVQASDGHYCTPRENYGGWWEVEVGYPSVPPPDSWKEYAEVWDEPTETVYGYVPVRLVREFIDDHGGEAIDEGDSR